MDPATRTPSTMKANQSFMRVHSFFGKLIVRLPCGSPQTRRNGDNRSVQQAGDRWQSSCDNREYMLYRLLSVLFAISLTASAQGLSVKQLMSFLQSSIQIKQTDKEVAGFLAKARMTERLDDRTIEELQGLGVGPRTLAALRLLRDQSAGLGARGAR